MTTINDRNTIGQDVISDRSADPAFSSDVAVPAPLDVFETETLVTISQVFRRPPELELLDDYARNQTMDALKNVDEVSGLFSAGVPELAYRLASFLVRREGELGGAADPNVSRGVALLEEQLRMFGHLDELKIGT
ncbi:MAG: hypothetical protein AAFO98_12880 [Pseudomonadota bacterium]